MMKKTLSVIMAAVMILTLFTIVPAVTAGALDDGNFTYTVDGEDVTITGLVKPDEFDRTIHVPEKIDGKWVVGIADSAFENLGTIYELSLPKTLNTIGERAFYGDVIGSYVTVGQGTLICSLAFGYGDDPKEDYSMTIVGGVNSPAYQYCQLNETVRFIDVEKYNDPEFFAYVGFTEVDEQGNSVENPETGELIEHYVLYQLEVGELPEGAAFDLETFTLTLTNFNRPDLRLNFHGLSAHALTVKVVGVCTLAEITGNNYSKAAKLLFAGEGTLNINENSVFNYGVRLMNYAGENETNEEQVVFGENVKLNICGSKAAVRVIDYSAQAQPFVAENGQDLTVNCERLGYERNINLDGYISENNLPDAEHPTWVGDSVVNKNDPDGLYCVRDDENGESVYRYYFDEAHDLKLIDYSVAPVAFDGDVYTREYDRYNNRVAVRTQSYYTDTYKVIQIENKDYLIAAYVAEDLLDQETFSVECDCYPFEYSGAGYSSDGYRYAVFTGDPERLTIDGPAGQNPKTATDTVTAVVLNPNGLDWLGYRATSNTDAQGIYAYYSNEEEDEVRVSKYIYDEQREHYFEDPDFETAFLTKNEFGAQYTPVTDLQDNNVALENLEYYSSFTPTLYTDQAGVQYACTYDYVAETEEEEITGVYTFSEIPALERNGEKKYYFEPAELSAEAVAKLKKVTEYIETDTYIYTIPSEFNYNQNVQIQSIDALDVGNVWTHPLISGNPGCQPCYVPFIAEVNPDIEGAYVYDEIWTNTKDGSTSSKLNPQALKPGYAYNYTMVVKAQPGYRFNENLAFTYLREAAPGATLTFSADKKTLTVTGLETVTFLLDTPALGTVANTYNGVKFTWKTVKGAVKFRVFRKYGNTGWTKIADTTATSYEDKKVSSGVKYTYTVRCVSADGKVLTSGFNTVGKAITYVAAPRITKFENVNSGTKLTWSASKGATYYRVMYKKNNTWTKLADVKGTSYIATKMASGTKRYYTVRAMNASKQFVSAYNTTGWPATFIAAPALPKLVNTKNGVQVSYTKPKGSTYVRVMRKTAKGKWVKIADTAGTKIVDKTAKKGVKYFYTVRCIAKGGKSFQSGYNATGRAIVCKR